jgi:ketosteroid isomerase-like protein
MNKILFFITVMMLIACGCNIEKKKVSASPLDKLAMMDADRAFSKLSEEKGMKTAFLEYIDSNGVLLRDNFLPIAGADAIDYLIQQNDTGYTLKWEPRNGAVAKSGELGYTYGVYALTPSQKDTVIYGTYVSIWKKELNGNWKFVLDSGNEGIGDMKDEE